MNDETPPATNETTAPETSPSDRADNCWDTVLDHLKKAGFQVNEEDYTFDTDTLKGHMKIEFFWPSTTAESDVSKEPSGPEGSPGTPNTGSGEPSTS